MIALMKYLFEINFYNKDKTKENYPQKAIEKNMKTNKNLLNRIQPY